MLTAWPVTAFACSDARYTAIPATSSGSRSLCIGFMAFSSSSTDIPRFSASNAIRLASIETYRQKATAAEQAEDWDQALNAYQQALQIDPNVRFAELGKQRSLAFIRIDKRINFFLKQPAALESDRQLDNAIELIAEIEDIDPKGPRLKDRFDKLKRLVDAAQTPVKIILESDNFTEVAVYKVGKLGRFASQELSLRPGTYTVVGTRDGYQDVRKKIVIKPGQGPMRIAVKCEVEI